MKKRNLFRRICRLGAWCALSGMSVLAACTDEAATGLPAEGAAIRFDVGLSETWESGGSAPSAAPAAERPDTLAARGAEVRTRSRGAASNISVTVIDGLPPRIRTATQTRGAKKVGNDTDNGVISFAEAFGTNGFGVLGYACDEGESNWWTYITNTQIIDNGGSWEATDGQTCNWPGTWRNCRMRLFAYAPYTNNDNVTYNTDGSVNLLYGGYETAEDQKEFLVATTNVYNYEEWSNWSDDDVVNLNFTHTLTAVGFRFIFRHTGAVIGSRALPKEITGITINGVATTGTYSVTCDDSNDKLGEWEEILSGIEGVTLTKFSDDPGTEFGDIPEYNEVKFTDGAMCWPSNLAIPVDFFLMVPQTLSENTYLTVSFRNTYGSDADLECCVGEFKDLMWVPGKTVIYTIVTDYEYSEGGDY